MKNRTVRVLALGSLSRLAVVYTSVIFAGCGSDKAQEFPVERVNAEQPTRIDAANSSSSQIASTDSSGRRSSDKLHEKSESESVDPELNSPEKIDVSSRKEAVGEIRNAEFVQSEDVKEVALAPPSTLLPLATALPAAPPEPFAFSSDPLGKLQAESLTPPKKIPLPNFPWVNEPQSTSTRFPDVVFARLWSFPAAMPSSELTSLPIEHPQIARVLPTLDRPSLPTFPLDLVPQEPEFTISLRTRFSSQKPDEVPAPASTLLPFELKPVVQDNPAESASWWLLLTPLAFLDPIQAIPERTGIPDPFEHVRTIEWKNPPADAIAPNISYSRPATLVLPVDK